jgi:serine phosphatase RsbU (regulator of sigma subunit)
MRSGGTERLAQLEAENARLRLDVEAARRKQEALERQHREHAELLEIQVICYTDYKLTRL